MQCEEMRAVTRTWRISTLEMIGQESRYWWQLILANNREPSCWMVEQGWVIEDTSSSQQSLETSLMTWRFARRKSLDLFRQFRRSKIWMMPLPEPISKYNQKKSRDKFNHLFNQEQLWTGCCCVHRGHVRVQLLEGGDRLGQHLQHILHGGAIPGVQGVWHRAWAGSVRPRQLYRGQDCYHGHSQEK